MRERKRDINYVRPDPRGQPVRELRPREQGLDVQLGLGQLAGTHRVQQETNGS